MAIMYCYNILQRLTTLKKTFMSIVVTLTPELEAKLREKATKQGRFRDFDQFVQEQYNRSF